MGRYRCSLIDQSAGGGGFVLTAEADFPIVYRFSMGGKPAFNNILVNQALDAQLIALRRNRGQPGKWTLQFDGPDGGLTIQNLWLLGRGTASGPNRVLYTLTDRRYALMRLMVDTWFNKMKVMNDFNNPSPQRVDPNVSILGRVAKWHFIPNTCRSNVGGVATPNPQFFSGLIDGEVGQYEPWTAYQALRYLTSDTGYKRDRNIIGFDITDIDGREFSFGNVLLSPRNQERRMLLKSWNPRKFWAQTVDELAALARVSLYLDNVGNFILEDLAPANNVFQGYGNYFGGGGIPIAADLEWDSPRDIVCAHRTYHEIRWDYDEQVAQKVAENRPTYGSPAGFVESANQVLNRSSIRKVNFNLPPTPKTVFRLENVVPAPQDIPQRGIKAGQWVEIFEILDAWEQQAKADPSQIAAKTAAFASEPWKIFSPDAVRRFVLSTGLAHLWVRDFLGPNRRFPLVEARVASIYQNYRRTFRIPVEWLDHIEEIRADVGTVFSPVSRTREPSPVRLDYHAYDVSLRRFGEFGPKSPRERGTGHVRNIEIDGKGQFDDFKFDRQSLRAPFNLLYQGTTTNDFGLTLPSPGSVYGTDFATFPSAPARVTMTDPARGVFRIDFVPDFSGVTYKMMPGLINPKTMPSSNIAAFNGSTFIAFARTISLFRMAVILSIRFRSPNRYQRHVSFRASDPQFSLPPARRFGPVLEIMSRGFEAYKTYEHQKVSWDIQNGLLQINHNGAVANFEALEELSANIFGQIYFRYIPRVLGRYSVQGWSGQFPIGHVTQTEVSLKANGAFETTLVGERPPTPPGIFEDLSSETRNLIQGFELGTRSDVD